MGSRGRVGAAMFKPLGAVPLPLLCPTPFCESPTDSLRAQGRNLPLHPLLSSLTMLIILTMLAILLILPCLSILLILTMQGHRLLLHL